LTADIYRYKDPVDKSFSDNQGIRFIYKDGSRVIFRQSGTGAVGMTIRIYFEKYEPEKIDLQKEDALKHMIEFGLKTSNISEFTGKTKPDVIT
jgi:phosphoglucomutase